MTTQPTSDHNAELMLRSCIQRVATGPEYSKDISFDEARDAMRFILEGKADPVQSGVFLIALRMKRETDEENGGALQAIIEKSDIRTADVKQLVDFGDPYDGYVRGLPATPFLPAVAAACGIPAVTHGLESAGPKFGATARKVLRAAGSNVDLSMDDAIKRVESPTVGWTYIDQKVFCPSLHNLVDLRKLIV